MRFRAEAGRTGEAVPVPTMAPKTAASLVARRLGPAAIAIYAAAHGMPARMVMWEPRIRG